MAFWCRKFALTVAPHPNLEQSEDSHRLKLYFSLIGLLYCGRKSRGEEMGVMRCLNPEVHAVNWVWRHWGQMKCHFRGLTSLLTALKFWIVFDNLPFKLRFNYLVLTHLSQDIKNHDRKPNFCSNLHRLDLSAILNLDFIAYFE